jgi:hypothetical protein
LPTLAALVVLSAVVTHRVTWVSVPSVEHRSVRRIAAPSRRPRTWDLVTQDVLIGPSVQLEQFPWLVQAH